MSAPTSSAQPEHEIWYEANCHCGTIKYAIKLPPLESMEIMSCNCSICTKNGYLNVYPKRKDIVFEEGEGGMKVCPFRSLYSLMRRDRVIIKICAY